MEENDQIANWVREARTGADLTGEELGTRLEHALGTKRGHSKANISHWETGKHKPSLAQLLAISKITGKQLPKNVFGLFPEISTYQAGKSSNQSKDVDSDIEIPQYHDHGGSMGGGILLRDQPGEIHGWRVTPEWIAKNLKNHTGAANLCIVTGFGDSMQPMFNPGDPLLVDTGIKSVEFDSVYFFRVGNEGFVKRLQRIPGEGLRVLSKNKDYDSWTIKPDMDFEVFGRVIKVWCGSDY
jgi:phage repressor protein C with HTH and peptisase S24 domain